MTDALRFARGFLLGLAAVLLPIAGMSAAADDPIEVLFLGDRGHHRPAERFAELQPVLAARGIELTYTERLEDLNPDTLAGYRGLMIYANIEHLPAEQEAALIDYVAGGGGLIPLHCASFCFLNSDRYIELVGAQFQRHGGEVFRATIVEGSHPLMRGYGGFESWDETYVHHRHNEADRIVLSYRVDAEGREPWTWIRTHGEGRVFYTAWGHDHRTWLHPGFQNLVERGVRWAVGGDPGEAPDYADPDFFPVPEMTPPAEDLDPVEYVEAEVPYYPPSQQWGTQADPITRMQVPLPAEESIKHFSTPVGFEVQLFASDPEIVKPICMNWDERGRLWIAETVDYPNDRQPAGEGRDRIKICEDTDGDGRADQFTVFAEELSIPTSIVFHDGGVIVHQAPDTLFLRDLDGDDVADERRVLFTGWSVADTHAGPSNMRYGLDNWIWGMVGYAGFTGQVGSERHSFRTGFYRFRPDGRQMEFLRNTNNNSWGVGFSEEGLLFGSTANGNPSVYMPIANRYYEQVRGWSSTVLGTIADTFRFQPISDNVRQVDYHGGYTAGAGHALYTARQWPREYWNRTAFVTEPTGHLIGVFHLRRRGADFQAANLFNMLASDDEWSAPIMAEVGPDGQLWVIDWYNYIVQHNPTPRGYRTGSGNAYESDLRDKRHGRIYRIVYTGSTAEPLPDLVGTPPEQWVSALRHPNQLWRMHAQRLLVERGETDVADQLVALIDDPAVDELGLNVGAIHALWTLKGLGLFESPDANLWRVLTAAVEHPSPGVRRNALLVAPRNPEALHALNIAGRVDDPDALVRLAALLALAEMPAADDVGGALVECLLDPVDATDPWIADAATSAAATHLRSFLTAAFEVDRTDPRLLTAVTIVCEHLARGGDRRRLSGQFANMTRGRSDVAEAAIEGLLAGWPADEFAILDRSDEEGLVTLVERLPAESRGPLVRLAARLGNQSLETYTREISAGLLSAVHDEQRDDDQRLDAARELIAFRATDVESVEDVLAAITVRMSPGLAAGLVDALRGHEADESGVVLIDALADWPPTLKVTAIRVLLSRAPWTTALLDGLEKGQLALSDLALDQKQALTAHPEAAIAERARDILASGGVTVDADRARVLEALLPLASEAGDPVAGLTVYQNHCAKCHVYRGEGQTIGPDLSGMAVHPREELLTQIIDPSRSLEGNYRSYTVVTLDGRVINGLLASETRTTIELFDTEGNKQIVLREDIDELVASPKSLMPEGFEEQLKPEELVNLLAFLSQRQQFVPLPIDGAATIVSTRGMFYDADSRAERLIFEDWGPKEFAGVPFVLVDPQGERVPNVILLHSDNGRFPPRMPRQVELPVNGPARAIHFLSGVSGWGAKAPRDEGSVSLIVRLHYEDGSTEEHPLLDGVHFADYIGDFDVPESEQAFLLRGRQQIRYLRIEPRSTMPISRLELIKGEDRTAPLIVAITVESLAAEQP